MMTELQLVSHAARFAAAAHKNQTRRDLVESYINHPLRVGHMAAELYQDAEFIAACYLHDVVEDTDGTLRDLQSNNFPDSTIQLVDAVTKIPVTEQMDADTAKKLYYKKICTTRQAPLLKILDRIDNLEDALRTLKRNITPSGLKWTRKYLSKTYVEFIDVLDALDNQYAGYVISGGYLLIEPELYGGIEFTKLVKDMFHSRVFQLFTFMENL